MPPGRERVVIIGISVTRMLRSHVAFPSEFSAMTLKLYEPVSVGIPVIAPVVAFKIMPTGSEPLLIDQVIGVDPVAVSLWL